jgi:hypothetical protein
MLRLSSATLVNKSEGAATAKPKGAAKSRSKNHLSKTQKNGSSKKRSEISCAMCTKAFPVVYALLGMVTGLPIDICGWIAESWVAQNLKTDFVVLHTSRRMKHMSCRHHFKNAVDWFLNVNPTNSATISCQHPGCYVRIDPLEDQYFIVEHSE